jgi:hypothetical protein
VHCGGDDRCWEAASRDRLDAGAVRHLDVEATASGVDIVEEVYIGSAEEGVGCAVVAYRVRGGSSGRGGMGNSRLSYTMRLSTGGYDVAMIAISY